MVNDAGRARPPRLPLPLPPGKMHTVPGARIGKEGPIPGYTGTIPAYRNHIIGHGYSDGSRRAAALTDSFRHNTLENAYHLVCTITIPSDLLRALSSRIVHLFSSFSAYWRNWWLLWIMWMCRVPRTKSRVGISSTRSFPTLEKWTTPRPSNGWPASARLPTTWNTARASSIWELSGPMLDHTHASDRIN